MGSPSCCLRSLITRRKSPSVKIPRSIPFASTTTALPPCALVIAMSESRTVASGPIVARCSPVRMTSVTFMTSARPIAPAGWFIA